MSSASPALAETFFPNYDWRVVNPPTYCVIEPSTDVVPESKTQGYINKFFEAVSVWSQKLIAEDPNNRNSWAIKTKLVSQSTVKNDADCDIPVRFEVQAADAIGRYCYVGSDIFWPDRCSNPPKEGLPWIIMYTKMRGSFLTDSLLSGVAKHEIGHSFGLGHFYTDDNELSQNWIYTEPPPSIMFVPGPVNPEVRTITSLDVNKVKELYGLLGFFAFSPTPIPEPEPKPIPKPEPKPKPLPKSFDLFDYIKFSGEEQILRPTRSYETVMFKITGQISESEFLKGINVHLLVFSPSHIQTLKLTPTGKGYFETPFIIDKDSPLGEYRIQGVYQNKQQINKDIIFNVLRDVSTTTVKEQLDGTGSKQTTPVVSGIREFTLSFSDDEHTVSGLLSGYDKYVRLIAENECPFKKEVHNQDYLLSSKRNTEVSFTFHQLSYDKPSQCTIHLTLSDFDGNFLEESSFNYKIQTSERPKASQEDLITHAFSPTQKQVKTPKWIKNNAGWWAEGKIGDSDFVSGIQYLIKENIISIQEIPKTDKKIESFAIPDTTKLPTKTAEAVPDWVRNNAGWWADGLISEDDFLNGIKHLVEQGIIRV